MDDNKEQIYYGVWIVGKGWLKAKDVIAFPNKTIAQQVAKRIGNSAVLYIDKSIQDLEHLYLVKERKSLWHTLQTFLHRNRK